MVLLQKRLGNLKCIRYENSFKMVEIKKCGLLFCKKLFANIWGGFALNYWPYSVNGNNGTRNLKVLLLQI